MEIKARYPKARPLLEVSQTLKSRVQNRRDLSKLKGTQQSQTPMEDKFQALLDGSVSKAKNTHNGDTKQARTKKMESRTDNLAKKVVVGTTIAGGVAKVIAENEQVNPQQTNKTKEEIINEGIGKLLSSMSTLGKQVGSEVKQKAKRFGNNLINDRINLDKIDNAIQARNKIAREKENQDKLNEIRKQKRILKSKLNNVNEKYDYFNGSKQLTKDKNDLFNRHKQLGLGKWGNQENQSSPVKTPSSNQVQKTQQKQTYQSVDIRA